jgi:hypothetical protein
MRSRQAVIYTGAVETREARAITDSAEVLITSAVDESNEMC